MWYFYLQKKYVWFIVSSIDLILWLRKKHYPNHSRQPCPPGTGQIKFSCNALKNYKKKQTEKDTN